MKFLLLLLFSYIICSPLIESPKKIDSIDSIICTLKSDIFFKSISKIIEVIKTKDLLNIINTGNSLFNDLKEEFEKCPKKSEKMEKNNLNNDNEDDDDVKLGYPRAVFNLYTIIGERAFTWYDQGGLKLLKDNCYKYYGQNIWFCNFIRKQS